MAAYWDWLSPLPYTLHTNAIYTIENKGLYSQSVSRGLAESSKFPGRIEDPARLAQDEDQRSRQYVDKELKQGGQIRR